MHRGGESEGHFDLSRAAQHFVHVRLTRINMFILKLRTAQRDVRHIKHVQEQQEISTADLCLESKVSIKQFNRCVLCFLVRREEKHGEEPRAGAGWDWIFTAVITGLWQIYRLALLVLLRPASLLPSASTQHKTPNSIPADTEALINVRTESRERVLLSVRWNPEASKVTADLRWD